MASHNVYRTVLRVLLSFLALIVLGLLLFTFITGILGSHPDIELDNNITTTSSAGNFTSITGPIVFNIKKIFLDTGLPTGGSLSIHLDIPDIATLVYQSDTNIIIKISESYLVLQSVSEEYANIFEQKPEVSVLETSLGTIYRLPNPDNIFTNEIEERLGVNSMRWYYYVSLYSEAGCGEGDPTWQACGSHTISVTDGDNSDLLAVYCAIGQDTELDNCEALIKDMTVDISPATE